MSIFDLSSEGADRLLGISNIALVFGLVIALVATIGTIWASAVIGKYAAIRQAQTEVSIAEATSASKQADERAALANLAAAKANERSNILERETADLKRQAEEAKAETARMNERVKKIQEVRKLTPDQQAQLIELLHQPMFHQEPKVRITVMSISDSESGIFAQEFIDLFVACGVGTNPSNGGRSPKPFEAIQPRENDAEMILALSIRNNEEPWPQFTALSSLMAELGLRVQVLLDADIPSNVARLIILKKLKVA